MNHKEPWTKVASLDKCRMFSSNVVAFEGEYSVYLTEKDAALGGKRRCLDDGGTFVQGSKGTVALETGG